MPNQFMPARPDVRKQGVAFLGDALNMRHPFTGGGMTVGLTDAVNLCTRLASPSPVVPVVADAVVPQRWALRDDPAELRSRVTAFYRSRQVNSPINLLSVALFQVLSGDAPELRTACFSYLQKGPSHFLGPIRLLAGLSRSESLLLFHFFSVALYGVKHTVCRAILHWVVCMIAMHMFFHP